MKTLTLQSVEPLFFNVDANTSEIWGREITFSKEDRFVIAASGKGKSSLIHFLYGLNDEYRGDIKMDGKSLRTFNAREISHLRRHSLSIVFQNLRLFPNSTLLENIEIKRVLEPFCSRERIFEMAEDLGLEHKLHSVARECSYGEQQRAAIVRALMQPFDMLLLDEPFSHLDSVNRQAAWELIQAECRRRGAGMIFAALDAETFMQPARLIYL